MSKNIVISQSMYFPWIGMLEQLKIADVFVYYDDVNFSRGFLNRVQIKTKDGSAWLTVPIKKWHRGDNIDVIQVNREINWEKNHLTQFEEAYKHALYKNDALDLMEELFRYEFNFLHELTRKSTFLLSKYFDIIGETQFVDSAKMGIGGSSSERLFKICKTLKASKYITGHGAYNYLDHTLFSEGGIQVNYMNYTMKEYPQSHGEFTPYVSALDLVAHCGKSGAEYILPQFNQWNYEMQTH